LNQLYRSLVVERVRYAVASARAAAPLEHAGVKGAIRETLIADLFRPLLPWDVGIGTGILISAFDDQQSAQQDIVIFDRLGLPPLLFEQGPAIIPVESALATVEVKSRLSAAELKKAHENVMSVYKLVQQSRRRDEEGKWVDVPTPGPSALLLALESDLTERGKTEVERYTGIRGNDPPLLRGICVVGKGSWWSQDRFVIDRPSGQWRTYDGKPFSLSNEWDEDAADGEYAEVLAMLIAIHALVLSVASSRGQPPLEGYLI
jgi:hypothetical protein